ncbi:phosphoribosylamine--glycine ligase [Alicyclobacillus sacchari]|uniref:Phosphoribosylamine--glycine ligase n=1 Tax=Alicyclobacillus sacchari TaxID=392010 RepID=A0A4V3HER6_9BACL|nr:phosphoribosylamine--glycine ligase [Alicyclobacillus sacchari]TDY49961.1 phosphoribosylamine--glycine ligase [Alicyclobacillus sacchari]
MWSQKRPPRVAVVGQGAREHAIVWKLAQSPRLPELFALPGNPGSEGLATCVDVAAGDLDALVKFAQDERIDLVVVGPEQPLADGLVDRLAAVGIPAFGPMQAAAQLEASKAFSKRLMQEAGVPTARFATFTDVEQALSYLRTQAIPVVVKADGLAAGKGVVVAQTLAEAEAAVRGMLEGNQFGASGHRVVIEEWMQGQEVSCMYFVDANVVVPMIPARDFKRLRDGDEGPNTGGMGAFAPVPVVTSDVIDRVTKTIVEPAMRQLAVQGITYRGVLYAGLMLTEDGPKVVEFNARFGDPETEVILPLLASDLFDVMWAVAHDELRPELVAWRDEASVCVVMAGREYPAKSDVGTPISLPEELPERVIAFHAGTRRGDSGGVETAGGRVLTVSAVDRDVPAAIDRVYSAIADIHFAGAQYRRDIAHNWQR